MDTMEDEAISAINNAMNQTAVFPDDFFEEDNSNWENPQRDAGENESHFHVDRLKAESDNMDIKRFSMRDMLKIVAYSESILHEKVGEEVPIKLVPIKLEKVTLPSAKAGSDSLPPSQQQ